MTPMISNTGDTRFLFGTFTDAGNTPVFHGAVVYGVGLTYGAGTNLPNGGTVDRIEVQTRTTAEVLTTHATYPDINSAVVDLNTAFMGATTPWYDATDVLALCAQDDDAPLDLNVTLHSKQMDELASGKLGLHLKTGEFFTANELSGIFAATTAKVTPKQSASVKQKNRKNAPLAQLNAVFENAAISNLSDLEIEALENDLRVGAA